MSWVLHEIFPNYLIFKGEDAPSFSTLRQSCSVDQWAWPTQSSCVAPLPPLKEKTISIHSISSYHKLARIQETKINWQGSRRGWASFWEPAPSLWQTLRGTQAFLPLIFSSAPHPFLFSLFSIRGILEIKHAKQLLSKVNKSPEVLDSQKAGFLWGSGITSPTFPLGN